MTLALLLGMIGPWQIVLIVLVFLLMFGGKKILKKHNHLKWDIEVLFSTKYI